MKGVGRVGVDRKIIVSCKWRGGSYIHIQQNNTKRSGDNKEVGDRGEDKTKALFDVY